ncbi:sensor histidine kinase [Firmicutes bacterium CAG:466]|nr:sensor histidine kinase [Firmicutes bacterium CAG:466]
MKRISIKLKITIWYFILMTVMGMLLIGFLWFVSNAVTTQTAMNNVSQIVRNNLEEVDVADGKLQLGDEFQFYQNGVYSVIYSQKESLLAGQIPASFTVSEPFENGLTRMVSDGENRFYVFDLWCPFGWDNGVWVRGVMEVSEDTMMIRNLVMSSAAAMPIFILLATIGGYLIAKYAFRPLEQMIPLVKHRTYLQEWKYLRTIMNLPDWQRLLIKCLQGWKNRSKRNSSLLPMLPMS